MSQVKNNRSSDNDSLRRYIKRLEKWPVANPPAVEEFKALRREIHLNPDERDKLELLADNHMRRGRRALEQGAAAQAAAEMTRAAQLRPLDSHSRVELAEVYLQLSLQRGYNRNDRRYAVKLAQKALELNPADTEARRFLRDCRQMHSDFRNARKNRYIVPLAIFLLIAAAWFWRQRQAEIVRPPLSEAQITPVAAPVPSYRSIQTAAADFEGMALNVTEAGVGRQNDSSFVQFQGQIDVTGTAIRAVNLNIHGQNSKGETVFTVPWAARNKHDSLLLPGDSQPFTVRRWLEGSETDISTLKITHQDTEIFDPVPEIQTQKAEIIWDIMRPEGAALNAEIRNFQQTEAYDRQIIQMDLAVKNTGVNNLENLKINAFLNDSLPPSGVGNLPQKQGERYVWPLVVNAPADVRIDRQNIRINVLNSGE